MIILIIFFLFRISVLSATLHIIELYAKLYNSTSAFIELFNPVLELLSNYPLDKFSESIKVDLHSLLHLLKFSFKVLFFFFLCRIR